MLWPQQEDNADSVSAWTSDVSVEVLEPLRLPGTKNMECRVCESYAVLQSTGCARASLGSRGPEDAQKCCSFVFNSLLPASAKRPFWLGQRKRFAESVLRNASGSHEATWNCLGFIVG